MVADRFLLRISEWADVESLVAVFNRRFWRGCVCFFGGGFWLAFWSNGQWSPEFCLSVCWACMFQQDRYNCVYGIWELSFKKMDSGGLVGLKGHFTPGTVKLHGWRRRATNTQLWRSMLLNGFEIQLLEQFDVPKFHREWFACWVLLLLSQIHENSVLLLHVCVVIAM